MLDIRFIREHADRVREGARLKGFEVDVDALLAVDARRRELQHELDGLRHQQREAGERLAALRNPRSGYRQAHPEISESEVAAQAAALQKSLGDLKSRIRQLEDEQREVREQFDRLMLLVPQPPDPEVPVGRDETENVEIRRVGEPRAFDFEPQDHVQIGTRLGILSIEHGVKLAGSRNYVLKGDGALLHHAVLRLGLDMMVARGYEALHVPVLVQDRMMVGTGYYPGGEEQAYRCERDGLSLVGTAEVPVTALHADEILEEASLPRKYVALSPCFRREAGAAGRDTYGLYRIHLFDKVEQVIICRADVEESRRFHEEIVANAEALLQALGLPYRVVAVCTGDLGLGQAFKYDIETWMPSRGGYCETHSASRFYEFQARRLNMRYRGADREVRFCHTLNNTVVASPRILIPLLELYQNADGSVTIPEALRPYMGGRERIG